MNREIKFRAWHIEAKEMLYGTPKQVFSWLEEGQPIVVQQWIGLKDEKDNDVYEGDIMHSYSRPSLFNWLISFEEGSFTLINIGIEGCLYDHIKVKGFNIAARSVIGNIFENPGLLKRDTTINNAG